MFALRLTEIVAIATVWIRWTRISFLAAKPIEDVLDKLNGTLVGADVVGAASPCAIPSHLSLGNRCFTHSEYNREYH